MFEGLPKKEPGDRSVSRETHASLGYSPDQVDHHANAQTLRVDKIVLTPAQSDFVLEADEGLFNKVSMCDDPHNALLIVVEIEERMKVAEIEEGMKENS